MYSAVHGEKEEHIWLLQMFASKLVCLVLSAKHDLESAPAHLFLLVFLEGTISNVNL